MLVVVIAMATAARDSASAPWVGVAVDATTVDAIDDRAAALARIRWSIDQPVVGIEPTSRIAIAIDATGRPLVRTDDRMLRLDDDGHLRALVTAPRAIARASAADARAVAIAVRRAWTGDVERDDLIRALAAGVVRDRDGWTARWTTHRDGRSSLGASLAVHDDGTVSSGGWYASRTACGGRRDGAESDPPSTVR